MPATRATTPSFYMLTPTSAIILLPKQPHDLAVRMEQRTFVSAATSQPYTETTFHVTVDMYTILTWIGEVAARQGREIQATLRHLAAAEVQVVQIREQMERDAQRRADGVVPVKESSAVENE